MRIALTYKLEAITKLKNFRSDYGSFTQFKINNSLRYRFVEIDEYIPWSFRLKNSIS